MSRIVTNKELSKWCAEGKGQLIHTGDPKSDKKVTYWDYSDLFFKDNDSVGRWVKVRKWDDDDWYRPTAEYLGLPE